MPQISSDRHVNRFLPEDFAIFSLIRLDTVSTLNIETVSSGGSISITGFCEGVGAQPVIMSKISKIVLTDFIPE